MQLLGNAASIVADDARAAPDSLPDFLWPQSLGQVQQHLQLSLGEGVHVVLRAAFGLSILRSEA